MADAQDLGILVTWRGVPCAAVPGSCLASRSLGLQADSAHVTMPSQDFARLTVKARVQGLFLGAQAQMMSSSTEEREPATEAAEAQVQGVLDGELDIVGDLVFDDGVGHVVTLRDMYLAEEGIEVVVPDQGGDGPLARFPLVDIRYWWAKRGTVPAMAVNILGPDGNPRPYSLRPQTGGVWHLDEWLPFLQGRLPGGYGVARIPQDLREEMVPGREFSGAELAVDEVSRLCEIYGIELSLDVDPARKVSFWRRGEGVKGHGPLNAQPIEKPGPAEELASLAFSYPPAAILVVGGRTIREVALG